MLYLRGFPTLATGKIESDVGGINVLASRQAYRPLETALAQSLPERPAGSIPRIGKDASEPRAGGDDAVDLFDSDLRLRQCGPAIPRHVGPRHALGIIRPALREGTAAGPPSPEPRATPASARPATGN